jgi:hypothetical protein
MSSTRREAFTAGLIIATAVALLPLRVSAETLPNPLQKSIIAAIASGKTRPEQCPAPSDVSALASATPELTIAIAAFTADELRNQNGQSEDSRCDCMADIATALATVSPDTAADVRTTLSARFPDCSQLVTEALEDTLTATTSGPPKHHSLPGLNLPVAGGGGGGSDSGCTAGCAAIEPPDADQASRTTF